MGDYGIGEIVKLAAFGVVAVPVLLILLALSCAGVQCPVGLHWDGWLP